MRYRAVKPALLTLALLALLALSQAPAQPQRAAASHVGLWHTTARVSLSTADVQANIGVCPTYTPVCGAPSISSTGRFVAFTSGASNLVAGDTNATEDIFFRDRDTDTDLIFDEPGQVATFRVSVSTAGAQGNGPSWQPSMSSTGQYIAFASLASNLVAGDTNGTWDIFVRDILGPTVLISKNTAGVQANGLSMFPSISGNGRFVTFTSFAANLNPSGLPWPPQVYFHDRDVSGSGTFDTPGNISTVLVSGFEGPGNDISAISKVSAEGHHVSFMSLASNLVSGDTNGVADVFVWNHVGGAIKRVSVKSDGTQATDWSSFSSISGTGRFVAFTSAAPNLVAGDTNGVQDIFLHDRDTDNDGIFDEPGFIATTRVSVADDESQANGPSDLPSFQTGSPGFVAFYSYATNLVTGGTNGMAHVFVRDIGAGTTALVSVSSAGAQGNGDSEAPDLSAGPHHLAFVSKATNLVSGDTNGVSDVFVAKKAEADFTLACTPNSLTIPPGGSAATTCTLGVIGPFSSAVTLSCVGLPSGATCTFSPASVTPPASSIGTVSVGGAVAPGTYPFDIQGVGGAQTHTFPMTLIVAAVAGQVNTLLDLAHVNDTNSNGAVDAGETPSTACTTATPGLCSLRAMLFARNSGGDAGPTITFAPGLAPSPRPLGTINLDASFPAMVVGTGAGIGDGFSNNIVIDGGTLGAITIACPSSADKVAFMVFSAFNTITNLVLNNCSNIHILIGGDAADSNTVVTNRIGVNAAGSAASGVKGTFGVVIAGGADANLVASNQIGNTVVGVAITNPGTTSNSVLHNMLGTTPDGLSAIGNTVGIVTFDTTSGSTIAGNTISGNSVGIWEVGAFNNTITNNCIGLGGTFPCMSPLGNSGPGIIEACGSHDNVIGGTSLGSGNLIGFNGFTGVILDPTCPGAKPSGKPLAPDSAHRALERLASLGGRGPLQLGPTVDDITIRFNAFVLNTGKGIRCTSMPGPGMPCDPMLNDSMMPPFITSCTVVGTDVNCSGSYPGPGGTTMTIDVYGATPGATGEPAGVVFICSAVPGVFGSWSCPGPNPGPGFPMAVATATNNQGISPGLGSTSEFSFPMGIAGPQPTPPAPTPTPRPRPVGPPGR